MLSVRDRSRRTAAGADGAHGLPRVSETRLRRVLDCCRKVFRLRFEMRSIHDILIPGNDGITPGLWSDDWSLELIESITDPPPTSLCVQAQRTEEDPCWLSAIYLPTFSVICPTRLAMPLLMP